MFYKLMYKRSMHKYRNSYINILCVFILTLSMLSFTSIYCDSHYNYIDAVTIPSLENSYHVTIMNITEEEAEEYSVIKSINPHKIHISFHEDRLYISLHNPKDLDGIVNRITEIFDRQQYPETYTDTTPGVYIERNRIVTPPKVENGARIFISVLQVILGAMGVVSMVLIYSDYIRQRTEDIRTLSAIGITERQLHRLFFGECNVLYLLSVVIGIPLGGGIAYVFFKVCEWVDMSDTNSVYPVFDLHITSLLTTALIGYMAVYITFQIILKKILRIDASYTCAESVIEFDPDKFRGFYYKAPGHFKRFFAAILCKRTSARSKFLTFVILFALAISLFMLNGTNYSDAIGNSYGIRDAAAVAAVISSSSLFIMTIVFAVLYSLSIISIFTKRQMESVANAVQTLYALGADEHRIYAAFRRHTVRKATFTLLFGFAAGYAATVLVFGAFQYKFYINLWFIIVHLVLIVLYYFVYLFSMKKYFNENCRSTVSEEVGG